MSQSISNHGSSTLFDQARSITLILESELGVDVTLYDTETGEEIRFEGSDSSLWHESEVPPAFIRVLALRKRAVVTELDEKSFRVILPIREGGLTPIVGLAILPRLTQDVREQQRVEKWCALLLDKLAATYTRGRRPSDTRQRENQACSLMAAFDVLLRNTRLHGDSARFQRNSLKAILEVVGVEAAIWVWGKANAVMVSRRSAMLSDWECHQFADSLAERKD